MIKEWYKDWFASENYLDVYKHRNSEDTEQLFNLILSNLDIKKRAKVLDAACGAGRYSLKFAEQGFIVTGFDLSKTLLNIAETESEKKNLKINFINSDLRTFHSNENFDVVINLFTSFGYFESDEENFLFPQNAFNLLNNNGYYVFDYLNKDQLVRNLIPKSEKRINGSKIKETREIIDGRVVKSIQIEKGNDRNEYLESVKLYSKDELIDQFSEIGYKVKKIFGDYLGGNFDKETSERCIIIFQK